MTQPATDLDDRYGRTRTWRAKLLLGLVGASVVLFGAWVAWAVWFHGTPAVTSELVSFDVRDEHTVAVRVDVTLRDAEDPSCRVVALSADKVSVGALPFTPVEGANHIEIRTERRATAVESVGCTAVGQPQPR